MLAQADTAFETNRVGLGLELLGAGRIQYPDDPRFRKQFEQRLTVARNEIVERQLRASLATTADSRAIAFLRTVDDQELLELISMGRWVEVGNEPSPSHEEFAFVAYCLERLPDASTILELAKDQVFMRALSIRLGEVARCIAAERQQRVECVSLSLDPAVPNRIKEIGA